MQVSEESGKGESMNEGAGKLSGDQWRWGWDVVAIERKEQMCKNRIVRCDVNKCPPGAPGERGHSLPGSGV